MKDVTAATRGAVKSKTVYLGLVVGVLGYVQLNKAAVSPFIPEKWFGVFDIGLGVAIIIARFLTSQSLTDKGATDDDIPNQ